MLITCTCLKKYGFYATALCTYQGLFTRLKESLDMFEEPRFIPCANLVQLSRFATVDQVPGHYNGLVD